MNLHELHELLEVTRTYINLHERTLTYMDAHEFNALEPALLNLHELTEFYTNPYGLT
jgi:hypothetical protein